MTKNHQISKASACGPDVVECPGNGGSTLTASDDLTERCRADLGRVLNRKWRLDTLLGVGGMAAVYAATHRNGARSAIKLIHGEIARDPLVRSRFLLEAYIANRVGHPGAVKILDDDIDEQGCPYIVMELLEGETLEERSARSGGVLEIPELLAVADEVLAILAASHAADIVHRDVKPENVFLTEDGQTKLLDFGIARVRHEGGPKLTQTGFVLGTPAFIAPELALGRHEQVDRRTDLWAVGAIIYTLSSGHFVHDGETPNEVVISAATRPARSLSRVAPGAPLGLVHVVDRALQYEPSARFDSAAEMREAIAALFKPEPEGPRSQPRRPSAAPDTTYRQTVAPRRPSRTPPAAAGPSAPAKRPSRPADTTYRKSATPPAPRSRPRRARGRDESERAPATGTAYAHHSKTPSDLPPKKRSAPKREAAELPKTTYRYSAPPPPQRPPSSPLPSRPPPPSRPPASPSPPPRPSDALSSLDDLVPAIPELEPRVSPPPSPPPPRRSRTPAMPPPPLVIDEPKQPCPIDDSTAIPLIDDLTAIPLLDDLAAISPSDDAAAIPLIDDLAAISPSDDAAAPARVDSTTAARAPSATPSRPAPAARGRDASPFLQGRLALGPGDVTALKRIFELLGRLLSTERQYGPDHPESQRRRRSLEDDLIATLERSPRGLAWEIAPYAFVAGGELLWEPEAPFDRIPYQLFADGLRTFELQPGLEPAELTALLELLLMDRGEDMPPEDDFVTLLWEASFDHVDFHAIDTFSEGDQDERSAYELERQQVLSSASREDKAEIEGCWQEERARGDVEGQAGVVPNSGLQLLGRLSEGHAVDVESIVQALAFGEGRALAREAGELLGELTLIDGQTQVMLEARLDAGSRELSGRFGQAVAQTYAFFDDEGDPRPVGDALRRAVDGLAEARPLAALDMIRSLCGGVEATCPPDQLALRRARLTGALVSRELLLAVSRRALSPDGSGDPDHAAYVEGLHLLLANIDGAHLPAVLAAFSGVDEGPLFELLLDYVRRVAEGGEAAIGDALEAIGLAQALALIRLLGELDSDPAREAITRATHSPHAVVRIEAIGFLEGASSARLREELRGLLQDHDAEVRLTALELMKTHQVRVAGPFLAIRIRAPAFLRLPSLEKRQAFLTLGALAPARTETICLELLEATRLVANATHEETREIAAETLGLIGASRRVVEALTRAAEQRWKSSERVRTAARLALDQVERRLASGERVELEGQP